MSWDLQRSVWYLYSHAKSLLDMAAPRQKELALLFDPFHHPVFENG
jgi:hypothetical protein